MKVVFFLILLLIFLLPIGQLGRLEFGQGVVLFYNDFVITLTIVLWIINSLAIRKSLKLPPISLLVLLFIGVSVLSLLNGARNLSVYETLVSSLYLLRWVEYVFLFIIVWDLSKKLKNTRKTLIYCLIASSLIVAILGFFQLRLIPDFSEIASLGGWDPHQGRILSTFFDPNFVGGFFVLSLSLTTSLFLFSNRGNEKLFLGASGLILLLALILTLSRSSYLALAVAALTFAFFKSRKIFIAFLIIGVLAITFLPNVKTRLEDLVTLDKSALARVESWQKAFSISRENLLLGVGFNSYRFAQDRYGFFSFNEPTGGHSGSGADSSLLLVLATTGILGLGLYFSLHLKIFLEGLKRRKNPLGLALIVSLFALFSHSLFVNSLFYPAIMEWLWILTGLTFSVSRGEINEFS